MSETIIITLIICVTVVICTVISTKFVNKVVETSGKYYGDKKTKEKE